MPAPRTPLVRFSTRSKRLILSHPVLSAFLAIAVAAGGYWAYSSATATPAATLYVLGTVQRGTITSSVTGSGQVVASDQVTINPKVSGQITAVYVHDGQRVQSGQALAQIDPSTALQALQSAQADAQSAQIALQKLQEPADTLSVTQARNALASAQDNELTSTRNLAKDYQDGYNDTAATYLDLPDIMSGLQDIITGTKASNGRQFNFDFYRDSFQLWEPNATLYHDNAMAAYQDALASYNAALAKYQTTSQSSSTSTIEATITDTYAMAQTVSTALTSANTFVNDYETVLKGRNLTPSAQADTAVVNLNSYINKMNSHISTLLADKNTLTADEQSLRDAARTITESQQSLDKLISGADPLDLQSSELALQQKRDAVTQAQDTVADYTIRAPFSGVLGNVNLHRGDNVGSGTAVAVEVSEGDLADLSLNEVDAAKVAVGQKASLSFDAIDGLTIAGHVASVSPVGTVSQGVVSYDVKIAFDTQDPRVKAGMTVNAAVITALKTDTLVVPSSAIKRSGGSSYVLAVSNPPATSASSAQTGVTLQTPPLQAPVSVGISSDTESEILSGLAEGEAIVVRTVSAAAPSSAQSAPSLFGGGARGASGGTVRVQTGTRSN